MKGKFGLDAKFESISADNLYLSEISLAELKFGVENSEKQEKNRRVLSNFLSGIQILPIYHSLDFYAKEKARLYKAGTPLDDFDLLIGATAVTHKLIMVTNNTDHFSRIKGIKIEDWTKESESN
jgi:tRNA(fMet)-specific endonuclease VapC